MPRPEVDGSADEKEVHPSVERLKRAAWARGWTHVELGLLLGIDASAVSRIFSGQVRPHLEQIGMLLAIIGEPRELFWGRHVDREAGLRPPGLADLDPAHLMHLAAGEPAAELPPLLAEMVEAGLPALRADPLEELPPELRRLDALRLTDVEAAEEECLEWIEGCHARLMADRLDDGMLAELITALAGYASILETRGELPLAAKLLAETLKAVRDAHTGLVFASLLSGSGSILFAGGYPALALAQLHQARDILATFEDPFEITLGLALGERYRYLGDHDMARRYFEVALEHQKVDESLRAVAVSNLAVLEEAEQSIRAKKAEASALREARKKKGKKRRKRKKWKKQLHPSLAHLRKAIEARGWTLAAVGRRMQPPVDPSILSRIFSGKVRPQLGQIDQILAIIGEPHGLFWGWHVDRPAGLRALGLADLDYAHIMRQAAGQPATELPPALAEIIEAGLPALREDPLEALPAKLRQLDELRLVDKEAANAQCLEWIEDCHRRMLADRLEPRWLAELITALGNYASILRTRGESRLAAALLAAAFEAVEELQTGLTFASLLGRSAPVLTDGGYPRTALTHLRVARDIFSTFDQQLDWITASISLGGQYRYVAQYDSARRCFAEAVQHPEINENLQAIALSNLAQVFEETRQPELAIELIETLESSLLGNRPSRTATNALWLKACALADCGELDLAAEILAELRTDVLRYCPAIDPILHFLDYASVLIRLGDEGRLAAATEVALGHFSQLQLDTKIFEVASRTISRIEDRSIRPSELKRIRKRLAS